MSSPRPAGLKDRVLAQAIDPLRLPTYLAIIRFVVDESRALWVEIQHRPQLYRHGRTSR